jgi:hypothetical protein
LKIRCGTTGRYFGAICAKKNILARAPKKIVVNLFSLLYTEWSPWWLGMVAFLAARQAPKFGAQTVPHAAPMAPARFWP